MENQIKALKKSAVSTLIALVNKESEGRFNNTAEDLRSVIEDGIDELISRITYDETAWGNVKDRYLYDIYLQMRESEGTLTEFDLVRPGLTAGLFSDSAEYHKHCVRVGENRANAALAVKTCSKCGETKAASKFSKKGGSACFS